MKVCTDACLFGSLLPTFFKGEGVKYALDIGTGTGLLSLMVAQKNNAVKIDAVEIDEDAAQQAKQNFQSSLWGARLQLICADVKKTSFSKKYDLIFSNPPFFEDDLKSNRPQRNTALHSTGLSLKELVPAIKSNLANDGIFAVLLPYHRTGYFEGLCNKHKFYCVEKVLVRQTPKHDFFRSILFFSTQNIPSQHKEIIIQINHQYSKEFVALLKDYYLYL